MYLNDHSQDIPKLRVYLNLDNLIDLRADSCGPAINQPELDARLASDGFEGVQFTDDAPTPQDFKLPFCGLDRINTPADRKSVV